MRTRYMDRILHTKKIVIVAGMVALVWLSALSNKAAGQNKPLKVTGGFSLTGRHYSANGIENRRAPLTGLANANLGFNLFGFQSGLNLTFTTEESRFQQSFNRLAFNTGWSWGRVAAGDVSPDMGRYSMQGSTVRGGYLEINTPKVFGAITGGQNRKAVNFDPVNPVVPPSYQRLLYSGNIGFGNKRSSFFSIGGMYANDVTRSVSNAADISPAENLVLTAEGGIMMFSQKLRFAGQVSTSALTRDVRNPLMQKESPIPSFIEPVIASRQGSSFNFAGDAELSFRSDVFNLNSRFSRINPGYESLGMQYLINDQQTIMVAPSFNLLDQKLMITLNYLTSRNNLNDQMLSTSQRDQIGINLTGRIGESLMLSGGYMQMGMLNNPSASVADPAAIQLEYLVQTFMFSPTWMINTETLTHTITFSGAAQLSEDRSLAVQQGLREGKAQDMYMGTLNYTIRFPSGFSLNNTGNYVTSEAPGLTVSSYGFTAGTGFVLLDKKLNININAGWSANNTSFMLSGQPLSRGTQQITGMAGANYRIAKKTSIRFQSRVMQNMQTQGAAANFLESLSEISLMQRL
jgi:hypothetical protein